MMKATDALRKKKNEFTLHISIDMPDRKSSATKTLRKRKEVVAEPEKKNSEPPIVKLSQILMAG